MNLWTKEEIYKILMQLDRMKLPFKNYSFVQENGKLKLLGSGGLQMYMKQSPGFRIRKTMRSK